MSILSRFTDFILHNRLQAMGVAFVIAYIPLLGSIGILIAGLVTLRKGALEGLLIVIATTLPYLLKYYTGFGGGGATDSDLASIGLILTLVSNILVWVFAIVLRRYDNWSIVLEYSVLLGIVAIGMIHIVYPDIQTWWATQLSHYFSKTTAMVSGLNTSSAEAQSQVIDLIKGYATGFIVVSILFNVLLQVALARWWQAVRFNPGGLHKELYQIRLSRVMGVLFIVGFGLSWAGNEIVMDIMPLLYSTFCAAGLCLAHYYFSTKKNTWVWLIILYLLLIWLFPLSIVIIALIALSDIWMDLRKRFVRPAG